MILADKWISLGILLDDQFDSAPLGRKPGPAAAVLNHMNAAIEEPRSVSDRLHPFEVAMVDLLSDLAAVMSPVWMRRHRHHITLWWMGVAQAIIHRTRPDTAAVEQRRRIRRKTVGMDGLSDLLEVACGFELPLALYAMDEIQRMRQIVVDMTFYQNDMCSLDHEIASGCDDNILLAWEADGNTLQQSIKLVKGHITKLADEFVTLTTLLPTLAQELELTERQRGGLHRWADTCALYSSGAGHSQAICGALHESAICHGPRSPS
ncbi:terpene synthase family protein [Amycolatopsis sp. NPDC051071]|uniref:terpene synthase family protein n=1 Tax=Amycolatopsis sp. NPDC051071 TaxID=3154637 RepID=UPI0034465A5D